MSEAQPNPMEHYTDEELEGFIDFFPELLIAAQLEKERRAEDE